MSTDNIDAWASTRNGEPKVGQSAQLSKHMTDRDVQLFYEITGDSNPIHFSNEAAEASVFRTKIVQGGLITGVFNAIVANQLPGPGTVFLKVDWSFKKPVYIDERVTGYVTITNVRRDKPICEMTTIIKNDAGDICLDGTAVTFTSGTG